MNCPSCNAKLDQDFGMVTCQSCKAVLMIDISGKIQTATDVPHPFDGDESSDFEDESVIEEPQEDNFNEGFDESDELVASGVDEENSIEEPEGDFFEETEQHDDADESGFQTDDHDSGDFEPVDDFSEDQDDMTSVESMEESFEEPMDNPIEDPVEEEPPQAQFDSPVEEDEEIETFEMPSAPDPDPVDITDFANSEDSNMDQGDLVYDITVSRLDSKDQKDSLKYVLLDEKLKINHHEFLKKIKGGKVVIPDLNPIKAKRIVEQLQFLDLDIKWRQKRVIIETVEPEIEDEESGEIIEDAEL